MHGLQVSIRMLTAQYVRHGTLGIGIVSCSRADAGGLVPGAQRILRARSPIALCGLRARGCEWLGCRDTMPRVMVVAAVVIVNCLLDVCLRVDASCLLTKRSQRLVDWSRAGASGS